MQCNEWVSTGEEGPGVHAIDRLAPKKAVFIVVYLVIRDRLVKQCLRLAGRFVSINLPLDYFEYPGSRLRWWFMGWRKELSSCDNTVTTAHCTKCTLEDGCDMCAVFGDRHQC